MTKFFDIYPDFDYYGSNISLDSLNNYFLQKIAKKISFLDDIS